MPNFPDGKQHTASVTVTYSDPDLATAATGLDSSVENQTANIMNAPPTGYQDGSIRLLDPISYFDGTSYVFIQQLQYAVITPTP